MNQTNAPLLEHVLEFTAARHELIAQNMANVDTPGYRQKDLDTGRFYSQLQRRAVLPVRFVPMAGEAQKK